MSNDKNETVHYYDGIEEQNNPMPDWWIWIFILTVVFSGVYYIHYTFGGGPTLGQEYTAELDAHQKKVDAAQASAGPETEESLTAFMKVDGNIQSGAAVYNEKCAMCHGNNLEGKIGPNLTDNFWISGKGSRLDLVEVVTKGVPAKGMPAWEGLLKPAQIKSVIAYVMTKKGSNPAGAKEPQGTEYK